MIKRRIDCCSKTSKQSSCNFSPFFVTLKSDSTLLRNVSNAKRDSVRQELLSRNLAGFPLLLGCCGDLWLERRMPGKDEDLCCERMQGICSKTSAPSWLLSLLVSVWVSEVEDCTPWSRVFANTLREDSLSLSLIFGCRATCRGLKGSLAEILGKSSVKSHQSSPPASRKPPLTRTTSDLCSFPLSSPRLRS